MKPNARATMTPPRIAQTISAAIAEFYSEGPSGGHFQNLMGPYNELGCGVATGGNGITFVQDLR